MRILVLSIYANGTWGLYHAQSHFFAATTSGYQHVIVCPKPPPPGLGDRWLRCYQASAKGGPEHRAGLRAALKLSWAERAVWDLAVICDSDAFPVRKEWAPTLSRLMVTHRRLFAAPVRVERGDIFPHVSFLCYHPKDSKFLLQFTGYAPAMSILRPNRRDTGARLPLRQCYPLLKSNQWSPSPLFHSIYGDMVYHQAGASRGVAIRGGLAGRRYWNQIAPRLNDPVCTSQSVTAAWINRLLGEDRFAEWPSSDEFQTGVPSR